MKARKKFIVVAYDIAEDRKRSRVAKILEKHGQRANNSVFECMLTDAQEIKLREQIRKKIDESTDSVIFYPICVNCYSKMFYIPEKKERVDIVKMV